MSSSSNKQQLQSHPKKSKQLKVVAVSSNVSTQRKMATKQKDNKENLSTNEQGVISMEKISHNLKQTEEALKNFKNSLYNISQSKTNLRTAESSQASLLFQTKFDASRQTSQQATAKAATKDECSLQQQNHQFANNHHHFQYNAELQDDKSQHFITNELIQ